MNRPARPPRRPARQGMVLLEVLAALTIFTLVAFSLIVALNTAFDAAEDRNQIDLAVRGLENQIEMVHSTFLIPTDKDLPDDGSGISYHLKVELAQFQDQKKQAVPGIYRVTITASWKMNGRPDDRTVSELMYQP